MKNFTNFFLIIFFTFTTWSSHACDFLDVPVGTPMAKLTDKYKNLYQIDEEETDDTVYKYTYRTKDFCGDEELNKTYLFVFVQNLKLIGFRVEILHDDLENDELYRFVNLNIAPIDNKAKGKKWFGTIQLDSLGRYILFSKRKTYDSKLLETLLITTGDYSSLIYGRDVEEVIMWW